MKTLLIFLISCLSFSMFATSCTEDRDFKDPIMLEMEGTWKIMDENGDEGVITFTHDETFILECKEGKLNGDVSVSLDDKTLSITYAEDEDGEEYLTDYDYEHGYFCKIEPIDENTCYITNLPYFKNKTVILERE